MFVSVVILCLIGIICSFSFSMNLENYDTWSTARVLDCVHREYKDTIFLHSARLDSIVTLDVLPVFNKYRKEDKVVVYINTDNKKCLRDKYGKIKFFDSNTIIFIALLICSIIGKVSGCIF